MDTVQLNPQQQQAIDSILRFVNSNLDCFILTGSAGTGKTTLIGNLVKELKKRKKNSRLVAPTGRAARIIHMKTNEDSSTIHGAIYSLDKLSVNDDATSPDKLGFADANDPCHRFFFPLRKEDPGNVLFIVDESSMVGDLENKNDQVRFGSGKLLTDLIHYTRLGRYGHSFGKGAKILFVGDPAQLPPVGQAQSPALSSDYLKEVFALTSNQFELTDVMRQAEGGEILVRATHLRDAILEKKFNRFSIRGSGKEINDISVSEAISRVADAFHNSTPTAFVTYTNAQALNLNRSVRKQLFSDETLPIQRGDILLVNKNCSRCQLFNGDLVKVIDPGHAPDVRDIPMKGVEQPVRLSFRRAEIAFRDLHGKVKISHCLLLENLLESKERELSAAESRALLVYFRMRHKTLKPGTAQFTAALLDDPYFNALQVKFGYALTCHKAQGGEWDTVAVDFSVSGGTRNESYFRWCYTAITRAKKQLLTISAPNFDEMSEMDWGVVKPQPAQDTHSFQLGGQIVDDPDWLRFSFAAGQENLFKFYLIIKRTLADIGAEITHIGHLQHMEKYLLTHGDKQATVQLYYKGDGSFSKAISQNSARDDTSLAAELSQLIERSLLVSSGKGDDVERDFIRQFRNKLKAAIAGTEIRILATKFMLYRYRVEFELDGWRSKIDFIYDGKDKWTKVLEVKGPGSSRGLKEKLQQLL